MNEIDKAREAAISTFKNKYPRVIGDAPYAPQVVNAFEEGYDAGYATATASIEALEAKLATAERLRQTMRANLFAIYNGTWTSSGCPTLAAFADSCLEHVDNELQKENTDA